MNKKLLAIAVGAALVAPMASMADTKVFGDTRVRYSTDTTDMTGMADAATTDSTNSRVRLGVESKLDGVTVKARIKATNGTHGSSVSTIAPDYGYMSVPVGPVTVTGGLMIGNFGNRLTYWDTRPNRVALSTKAGPATIALTFDKMRESGEESEVDKSSTKIIVNAKLPVGMVGVLASSVKDNSAAVTGSAFVPGVQGGGGVDDTPSVAAVAAADASSDTGTETIVYFRGNLPGDVMLMAEYNSRGGDVYKDVDGDAQNALYIHAIKKFGGITGEVAYAAANNGFSADDHFAPFSTIGTSQDTAMGDFGGSKKASVLALIGSMNVMPKMALRVGLAQYSNQDADGDDTGKANIMDLQATYKATKKTKIVGVYGTFTGDDTMGDLKYTVMGVRMETKF